jgi:hypothetical protein
MGGRLGVEVGGPVDVQLGAVVGNAVVRAHGGWRSAPQAAQDGRPDARTDRESGMTRRDALAASLALLLGATACGGGGEASPAPVAATGKTCVIEGSSMETQLHDTIIELADASFSAVEGTVADKRPGVVRGEETDLVYEIRTEGVLAGSEMPSTWPYIAGPYRDDACEISFNGAGILAVGDRAIFFVAPPTAAGEFRTLTSSQGRFRVDGDGIGQTARTDPLARRVEAASVYELRREVRSSERGRR